MTGPTTSPTPGATRSLLIAAALLTVMALGLSWRGEAGTVDGYLTTGWYSPGVCTTDYDYDGYATLDCSYSTYNAGYYVAGYDPTTTRGLSTEFRVFAAMAWALVLLDRPASRFRHRGFAPFVMGAGVIVTGLASGPGCFVAIAATAALAMATAPSRRRLLRRSASPVSPSPRTI